MLRSIFVFTLLIGIENNAWGCRFTVREIGFSTLSQDIYSLVIIDKAENASDIKWQTFHHQLAEANIKLVVLNPDNDHESPLLKKAKAENIAFPARLFIAPNGKMMHMNAGPTTELVNKVLDSSLRRHLKNDFTDTFCVIVWVEGTEESLNTKVEDIVDKECDKIKNIMPHMPKEVKNGPVSIRIHQEDFQQENVLLWSLGIEEPPKEPVAFVLYGRGRMIGEVLSSSSISDGMLYKYMSMIGADCECGLDRKWMLGRQIPLLWPMENRQQLADEIGFDVDNPMILAEMSRILAKEVNANNSSGDVGYGIEVIDLNEVFDQVPEMSYENKEKEGSLSLVYISLAGMAIVILGTGGYFYFRNRNN